MEKFFSAVPFFSDFLTFRRRRFKLARRAPYLSYRTGTLKKLMPSVRIYCPIFFISRMDMKTKKNKKF